MAKAEETRNSRRNSGARRRASVPLPSSAEARHRMGAVRQHGTDVELVLHAELRRLGLRFKVHQLLLAGKRRRADVVFPSARVVVFVDGCFWHVCPLHATWPKSNAAWWRKKLEENERRDRDSDARLREAGWTVVRVWGHEPPAEAAKRIAKVLLDVRGHSEALGGLRRRRS